MVHKRGRVFVDMKIIDGKLYKFFSYELSNWDAEQTAKEAGRGSKVIRENIRGLKRPLYSVYVKVK